MTGAAPSLFTSTLRSGPASGMRVVVTASVSGTTTADEDPAYSSSTVIGTSRTVDKLEACKEFGLDEGIATGEDIGFSRAAKELSDEHGADVILDLVGAAYFAENLASLAFNGRLVLVGLTSGSKAEFDLGIALKKRARIIGTVLRTRSVEEKADAIRKFDEQVLPLLQTGAIKPNIDHIFAAAEAVEAYKYLASNKSFGKIVLEF